MDDLPVRLTVADDLHRSRLTVFFRLLLAIPHFFWVILWSIAALFVAIAAWFVALFTARVPDGLHRFLASYVRYTTHLGAYLTLVANPYPGFTGEPGYPVDVELPEPRPQPRWKIALRLFLVLPALLVASVLGWSSSGGSGAGASQDSGDAYGDPKWTGTFVGVAATCAFLGWFVSLVRGRMAHGLRDLAAYGINP